MTINKTWDPATQTASVTSTDGSISSAGDLTALENADLDAYRKKWGRLSSELVDQKQKSSAAAAGMQSKIKVVVTLKPPLGLASLPREGHSDAELISNSLAIAGAKPIHNLASVLSTYGIDPGASTDDFSAIVDVTQDQLDRLSRDGEVAQISGYKPITTNSLAPIMLAPALIGQSGWDDIVTLAQSAYSHSRSTLPANIAYGAHPATFEWGLLQSYLSCMRITPALWDPQGSWVPNLHEQQHSLATFTCLFNAAPGANLYHRHTFSYTDGATSTYIVQNQLTSISMSANLGANSVINGDAMAIDNWAYTYPTPVIITTTDNYGWNLPSAMTGTYNQINVGNVQDSAWQHFRIDVITCGGGATQTINPPPINGSCIDGGTNPSTCAGDRETPYMVAPGYAPEGKIPNPPYTATNPCVESGPYMLNGCLNSAEPQKWGTSLSAPTLNGIVAGVQAQRPNLKYQPEAARAVLLATARNVTDGYWNQNIDGKDGAGVVHGADAQAFARNMVFESANYGAAQLTGYWWGSLSASDFNPTFQMKTFKIKIPASLPSGQHLRIVLTWDSSPDLANARNDLSDLDLYFSGQTTRQPSNSWDSNIEMIDVPNTNVAANATYTAEVWPVIWRHSSGALASNIYASIAWTFVADHAR